MCAVPRVTPSSEMSAYRKRKVLNLDEKVNALKKTDEGRSCRAVSSELGIGITQVQTIVKEGEDIS